MEGLEEALRAILGDEDWAEIEESIEPPLFTAVTVKKPDTRTWWRCGACGSLLLTVGDRADHEGWHRRLALTVKAIGLVVGQMAQAWPHVG